ncbi:MAG: hypothetical protein DRI26_07350 [Chloroflexi bacterium]|nr:MAG: hypothetical protein DRI26_07350 [Chloroflexota bacterium]
MNSFQDIKNASLYEPRIEFIKKQLESLLSVVDLEKDGQVVQVDGFRLKNLKDWLSPSPCDPSEVFDYAGTRCDCDCLFCYNKGNPPSLALGNLIRPPGEEFEEMKTRADYFFPKAGSCLFPSLGNIYEVMIHPHFLQVLKLLRNKTSKVFRITTSGTALTPGTISQLAELKPVYLYHSLNSASPSRRQKLMRDKSPQIAIQSLPLLKEAGIPYAVLVVPWPVDSLDEMLDDLSNTVAYADKHHCHLVEINLPGYSRYFSQEKLFDLDEVWSRTISCVRTLREITTCPIVVMPSMYEENLYEEFKNRPRIIGLVRNSPAARAGLARGDIILEINGIPIASRPQARDLLSLLQRSENHEADVTVERGGSVLKLSLNLEDYSYPYSREADRHLGIIFMGTGLRASYLEELRDIIDSHKAQNVLFLSSALMKPTFEQCLGQSQLFGGVRIDVQVPRNNFFGGNVFMGDLLVVQDFIDFIEEYLEKNRVRPDLIVIPSSPFNLGQWGRDLTGRVYLDIERKVGIPVELLECSTIYD